MRSVVVLLLLLGANYGRHIPHAPPAHERGLGPDGNPDDKLISVQALWRHGDRAPLHSFPLDVNSESDWPAPKGFLTPLGIEQQYRLGQWIRKRYVEHFKFLPVEFDPEVMKIRSTHVNRTIRSAQANLLGMYGPATEGVDIEIKPIDEDVFACPIHSCQRLLDLKGMLNATPEYKNIDLEHQELYQKLRHLTGLAEMNAEKINLVWDPLFLEKLHKMEIDPKLDELFAEIDKVYNDYSKIAFGFEVEPLNELDIGFELKKAWGGALLERMVGELQLQAECQNNPNREDCLDKIKYYGQSAHEVTVAGLMSTLGFEHLDVDRERLPELCSAVFVELWQNVEDDVFYIKMIYRRNESTIDDVTPHIGNCKFIPNRGCEFEKFVERSAEYFPDGDARTFCNARLVA